jgi:hypothetical protein
MQPAGRHKSTAAWTVGEEPADCRADDARQTKHRTQKARRAAARRRRIEVGYRRERHALGDAAAQALNAAKHD